METFKTILNVILSIICVVSMVIAYISKKDGDVQNATYYLCYTILMLLMIVS